MFHESLSIAAIIAVIHFLIVQVFRFMLRKQPESPTLVKLDRLTAKHARLIKLATSTILLILKCFF